MTMSRRLSNWLINSTMRWKSQEDWSMLSKSNWVLNSPLNRQHNRQNKSKHKSKLNHQIISLKSQWTSSQWFSSSTNLNTIWKRNTSTTLNRLEISSKLYTKSFITSYQILMKSNTEHWKSLITWFKEL